MKRTVYDKIGGLDERFGLGLFDDDDLAERARRAGFELAVAHDLFVHHFGSRTFLGNGIDIDGLLEENARRFAAKWGLDGGINGRQVVALRPWKRPEESVGNGVSAGPCATPGGRGSVRAAMASAGSDGASPSQDRANAPNAGPVSRVRVAWEGDFEALHSLAIVNRAMCRGLVDHGHDVRLIASSTLPTVETDERVELDARLRQRRLAVDGTNAAREGLSVFEAHVHVRHCWPPVLEPPVRGRCVLMQPWEFGSLPKAWVPMLRRVDEVWAYSRYVRDCFLEAEVPRDKIHVVPLGVAPEIFRPGLEPFHLQAGPGIRLLVVGGTIHRKGIDVLLAAFARAFRAGDGVGLVIKEMGSKSFYRGQTAEAEIAALRERGYAVEYIDRNLSEAEMVGLYCACDALVQPFRGEGFGLPIVEAMACGLPVIITGAGPALDYASDQTAYLIPAERRMLEERSVGGLETIDQPCLFEPDADALVELMKRVVSVRDGAKAIGTAASAHIREHFTWARSVAAVEQRLWALTRRPVRTLTRSVSEGLDRPSAESNTTRTRSASDGLHETREEREHPQPAGDCAAVLNGESCEPGQMPGTVAGSAGWAANASEGMPTLANASSWYVEPPSIVLKSRSAASVILCTAPSEPS
jgi:glycosyltransferase involved in cell wall biosynthesis